VSATVTFHLWWAAAYLATGAVSYVPLTWLGNRSSPGRLSDVLRYDIVADRVAIVLMVGFWPVAFYKQLRRAGRAGHRRWIVFCEAQHAAVLAEFAADAAADREAVEAESRRWNL
jgi:hypothetical protein